MKVVIPGLSKLQVRMAVWSQGAYVPGTRTWLRRLLEVHKTIESVVEVSGHLKDGSSDLLTRCARRVPFKTLPWKQNAFLNGPALPVAHTAALRSYSSISLVDVESCTGQVSASKAMNIMCVRRINNQVKKSPAYTRTFFLLGGIGFPSSSNNALSGTDM